MSVQSERWVEVKKAEEICLDGVTVELDWANNSIVSVKIIDANGHRLRVIKRDYGNMQVLVPETVEKYRLSGMACGLRVDELFDDESDARERVDKLLDHDSSSSLQIEKVKVPA